MRAYIGTALLMGTLLSGCSTEPVLTQTGINDPPDVVQARRVLNRELNETPFVSDVVFDVTPGDDREIDYTDPRSGEKFSVALASTLPNSIRVDYSPGSATVESAWKVTYTDYVKMKDFYWLSSSWSQSDAQSVADSLRILVLDAGHDTDKRNEADLEKVIQTCQPWIAQKNWPPMPEEVRQHKVLAENAYQESNFDEAIGQYYEALQIYPCWPDAWRKRGLMQAQSRYYRGAINSIRHYLALVPDAPDASDLRDKLIIWRDKTGG